MTADGPFFVDTNVLLYWVDSADRAKQKGARAWAAALWESGSGRTSWQVLNEFYVNATKKLGAPKREIRAIVEAYAQWQPVGFGIGLVQRAWDWVDQAGLPYWDALILSAAEYSGCRSLLSEDFQTDRIYGGVKTVNPFAADPARYFPK